MKNKNNLLRLFSLVAVLAMVAVMCFSLVSCGKNETKDPQNSGTEDVLDTNNAETPDNSEDEKISIQVTVVHGDGTSKVFDVETVEGATLRSALDSVDLVQGDEGPFGLYVKTVDGERADYDRDGAYWSFEQNGAVMMEGIDSVKVGDGDKFEIIYTAA